MQKKLMHPHLQKRDVLLRYSNWSWSYPDALAWMSDAKARLIAEGQMSIGIGSHDRDLVTLGRHTSESDILDAKGLEALEAPIYRIDRGGGATIHGPGQIVVYPSVSLSTLRLTVPEFTLLCEHAIIDCLKLFGIIACSKEKQPGVFVGNNKIGAIGFHVSQGCITHGFSLNVCNNLKVYNAIAPCGVRNAPITSMREVLGKDIELQLAGGTLLEVFRLRLGAHQI